MTKHIAMSAESSPQSIGVGLLKLNKQLARRLQEVETALTNTVTIALLEEKISKIEERLWENKEILTSPELCQYLNISDSYLDKLASRRLIPYYKPYGRYRYFNRAEIDKWVLTSPRVLQPGIKEEPEA